MLIGISLAGEILAASMSNWDEFLRVLARVVSLLLFLVLLNACVENNQ
jgi:hypothetical protein